MARIFGWNFKASNLAASAQSEPVRSGRHPASENRTRPNEGTDHPALDKAASAAQSKNQRQRFLANLKTPLEHGSRNIDRPLKGANLLIFKFTLENLLKELNSTTSSKASAVLAGELLANLNRSEIQGLHSFTPEEKKRLFDELNTLLQSSRETLSNLQSKFATDGLAKVFNPSRQSNIKQALAALNEATCLLGTYTAAAAPERTSPAPQQSSAESVGDASEIQAVAGDELLASAGPARTEVLERLKQVREHFKALHQGNWSPRGATTAMTRQSCRRWWRLKTRAHPT